MCHVSTLTTANCIFHTWPFLLLLVQGDILEARTALTISGLTTHQTTEDVGRRQEDEDEFANKHVTRQTRAIQFLARSVNQASVRVSMDLHNLRVLAKTTQDAVASLGCFMKSHEAQKYRAELDALVAEMARHQEQYRTLSNTYKRIDEDAQAATSTFLRHHPLACGTASHPSFSNSLLTPDHRLYSAGLDVPNSLKNMIHSVDLSGSRATYAKVMRENAHLQ